MERRSKSGLALLAILAALCLHQQATGAKMGAGDGQQAAAGTRLASILRQKQPAGGEPKRRTGAQLVALDASARRQVALVPGLLDETLLKRGSFAFSTKRVTFNSKLKVLGNVYVNRVNGRPLREAYLFKSTSNQQPQQQEHRVAGKDISARSWPAGSNGPAPANRRGRKRNSTGQRNKTGAPKSSELRLQLV